jgi:hypothetical protein
MRPSTIPFSPQTGDGLLLSWTARGVMTIAVAVALSITSGGCAREEKIIDIEVPGVDIEVKKKDGEPDVDVRKTEP